MRLKSSVSAPFSVVGRSSAIAPDKHHSLGMLRGIKVQAITLSFHATIRPEEEDCDVRQTARALSPRSATTSPRKKAKTAPVPNHVRSLIRRM